LDDRRLEPELVVMVAKPFVDRPPLSYVKRSVANIVQNVYAPNGRIVFRIVRVELDKLANTYVAGTLRVVSGT